MTTTPSPPLHRPKIRSAVALLCVLLLQAIVSLSHSMIACPADASRIEMRCGRDRIAAGHPTKQVGAFDCKTCVLVECGSWSSDAPQWSVTLDASQRYDFRAPWRAADEGLTTRGVHKKAWSSRAPPLLS
ncbi:hypothetical protein [Methylosinus sp. LW4]|uniref:hypothetical protein n=1 Tax=Methylosinus sp. LW4 TaxID=136993 RepID=UPI00036110DB|nr:hypothetical protein [Methylosinus sp. LW4]